jgi:hypothetical protein
MGLVGRTPKHDDDRVRRNAPIYEKIQVRWDGIVRGPELPTKWRQTEEGEYISEPWHPATLAWYELWRRTPQSMVFTDTDWEFFGETAKLHDRYWQPDLRVTELVALAGELRRREEAYGGTFEARRKLRMEIQSPQHDLAKDAEFENEVSSAVDYVEKLTKAAVKKKE